jgi:superfamily I DNA and/or RNA helicase
MNDERRMNVAITRAKHFLFVVGNTKTLEKNKVWCDYIRHCQKNEPEGGFFRFMSPN